MSSEVFGDGYAHAVVVRNRDGYTANAHAVISVVWRADCVGKGGCVVDRIVVVLRRYGDLLFYAPVLVGEGMSDAGSAVRSVSAGAFDGDRHRARRLRVQGHGVGGRVPLLDVQRSLGDGYAHAVVVRNRDGYTANAHAVIFVVWRADCVGKGGVCSSTASSSCSAVTVTVLFEYAPVRCPAVKVRCRRVRRANGSACVGKGGCVVDRVRSGPPSRPYPSSRCRSR